MTSSVFDGKAFSSVYDTVSEIQSDAYVPTILNSETMPTLALRDTMKALEDNITTTIRFDALIPNGEVGMEILQAMLLKISSRSVAVLTLSMKFTKLDNAMKDLFIAWIDQNKHLEAIYVMGSGFDGVYMKKLHNAWKRNLFLHRFENNGASLFRIPSPTPIEFEYE